MKTFMNFVEGGFAVAALTLVSLFCCYAWPESTYGLAAWVQAIGSILAIVGAVVVSKLQYINDLARDAANDRESTKRMLQSIYDEMDVVKEGFEKSVGDTLAGLAGDQYINAKIYITDRPFPVYRAYVSEIGNIADRDLRKSIIEIHTGFNRLILAINNHNDILARFQQDVFTFKKDTSIRTDEENTEQARKLQQDMSMCSHRLKGEYIQLRAAVILMLEKTKIGIEKIPA